MKIFFVDPNNDTVQVNYPLVEELSKNGLNVTYFSSFNRWGTQYYENNYSINSNYIFFKRANKVKNQKLRQLIKGLSYPFNLIRLFFIIINSSPDIIHFNNITISVYDFLFFRILKLVKFRVIVTQHNYLAHDKESVSKTKINALKTADKIICLSNFTKKQFPDILNPKIEVIKHGNVYEKEVKKFAKKEKEKTNKDVFKLLFFGLIRPYKGIENLIEAYFLLPESIQKKLQLIIIGRALNKSYLDSLVIKKQKHPNIRIVDQFLDAKNMIQIVQESDFGILPYISATQSGVPYLYTSLFKPIIVTNVGALEEQVDIKFAEVCLPKPESIADAISVIISRIEKREICRKDFANFNELNKWEKICDEYVQLYRNLLYNKIIS